MSDNVITLDPTRKTEASKARVAAMADTAKAEIASEERKAAVLADLERMMHEAYAACGHQAKLWIELKASRVLSQQKAIKDDPHLQSRCGRGIAHIAFGMIREADGGSALEHFLENELERMKG